MRQWLRQHGPWPGERLDIQLAGIAIMAWFWTVVALLASYAVVDGTRWLLGTP